MRELLKKKKGNERKINCNLTDMERENNKKNNVEKLISLMDDNDTIKKYYSTSHCQQIEWKMIMNIIEDD